MCLILVSEILKKELSCQRQLHTTGKQGSSGAYFSQNPQECVKISPCDMALQKDPKQDRKCLKIEHSILQYGVVYTHK